MYVHRLCGPVRRPYLCGPGRTCLQGATPDERRLTVQGDQSSRRRGRMTRVIWVSVPISVATSFVLAVTVAPRTYTHPDEFPFWHDFLLGSAVWWPLVPVLI